MAYVRPRFDAPIDLDAHLRALPPGATTRGMYFTSALAVARQRAPRIDVLAEAGLSRASYVAFTPYPVSDCMRLAHAVARHAWPDAPVGEGLRRLGQRSYDAFLDSHLGKVVFGAFGRAPHLVARHAAKGWGLSMNFGRVEVEEVDERRFRFHFCEMPVFLQTQQVGVVEGAMRATGVSGDVLVDARDLANLSMELSWGG